MALSWSCVGGTDRGLRRARNEDSMLVLPSVRLYAVADGMGGHAAGDVASRTAVRILAEAFAGPPSPLTGTRAVQRRLVDSFHAANQAILDMAAEDPALHGMGTTLTALATPARGDTCVLVHIGDSRAYLLRDGRLQQLTTDHTWVQQQVEAGLLSAADARSHPLSSVLTQVLGTASDSVPDELDTEARPGDLFLLCSDGLTGVVDDAGLGEILGGDGTLEAMKDQLIAAAIEGGGPDNITAVLVRAG